MRKETVKLLRASNQLNRNEFAEKVGVSRTLIAGIEDGWRKLSPRTERLIRHAFGLTTEDILEIEKLQSKLRRDT